MYKGKINQNRKYFDLSQFFALFFRKCLGNFLKELQFYTSGTTCFFIFCGAAKFCGCKIHIRIVKSMSWKNFEMMALKCSVAILVSEILHLVSAKDFGIWLSIWYWSVSHLVSIKKSSIFFSIWSIFQFFH